MTVVKNEQTSFYAVAGAVGNVANVLVGLSFAVTILLNLRDPKDTLFDPLYKQEGFCVTAPKVPYWTSHDICLYVDTIFALLLYVTYRQCHKTPGMEDANQVILGNIPGVFFHGLVHGILGKNMQIPNRPDILRLESLWYNRKLILAQQQHIVLLLELVVVVLFWAGVLKSVAARVPWYPTIFLWTVPITFGQALIPPIFGFVYVQTILILAFSWHQLNYYTLAEKSSSFAYATYPWVAGLPVVLTSWMESTQCTLFVKDYLYGHAVFDASIPVSLLIWYVMVHHNNVQQVDSSKRTPATTTKKLV